MTTPNNIAINRQPARQFCLKCLLTLLCILCLVIFSFIYLSLNPAELFSMEAMKNITRFVSRFFPPDVSREFLEKIWNGVLETLAISALATLISAILSIGIALPAAGRFGPVAKAFTRFFCNFLRSVPELVWAALMVLAVGLGPFAGVLALVLHTTGVLSRLFGESLENQAPAANNALILCGAGRISAFLYGTLPGVAPQLLSYTLYRWEMNIRMATILGFVGAGGLGQMLYYELSLLREPQTSTVIIAMLLLVVLVDAISNRLRRIQMHSLG
ncbi:phosphonate ABC transporter, permease protein PhnE [Polynucleobacter antarcticus]|uniref:phosphonate ABC transporter, permease protein PhnE n=1 Tax=Polynucleobacter antarcticus TaxID=1743162 RepID=UPI0015715F31|nr:phosphonate ABC transporter, permease protein PhnE [Polynucleobacter antarcticus]